MTKQWKRTLLFTLPLAMVATALLIPVLAGDVNNDGRADINVYHPVTGLWYVQSSNDGTLVGDGGYQFGFNDGIAILGDFDGDGQDDPTIYWPEGEGAWYFNLSNYAYGYGYGFDADIRVIENMNWGWAGSVPVPADYDGDGITDVAVYHPLTGLWYIRSSITGEMLTSEPIQFGFDEGVPVPGDYDGDGVDDLAVYWPDGPGTWFVWESNGYSPFDPDNAVLKVYAWGWADSLPVPGNYDGDSKDDIAVYDPETGMWYVLQSSDGMMASGEPVDYGFNGTIPVPDDYDGDGKDDLVVYWPDGNGLWFFNESNDYGYGYGYNPTNRNFSAENWGWIEAIPVSLQNVINEWFGLTP